MSSPFRSRPSLPGGPVLLMLLCLLLAACGSEGGTPTRDGDSAGSEPMPLDLVLAGGRVIDPDSGFDAVRDVGVRGGTIVAVSEESLADRLAEDGELLDVSGLVVAPGFIDLHAHGQSDEARGYQARDGVTTALELEWGVARPGVLIDAKAGESRIHYGVSVSHGLVRALAVLGDTAEGNEVAAALEEGSASPDPLRALQGIAAGTFYRELPEEGLPALIRELEDGLRAGGLGIGMAHQYFPGATRGEILRVFELAARHDAPIFTHVRSMGLDAFQEVIANAAATGAPLHIVHANSSGLDDLPDALRLIEGARGRGLDVTTEAYPYTAASTSIQSSIFDEGWKEALGIDEGDLQWEATGERLTPETFARYRREGGTVIIHMMRRSMIDLALTTPAVIVASDGMPYAPGAHPRTAGTFSRVLGRFVRERGVLELADALERMTILPARRLEGIAPAMRRKGRVQEGADADLTVFDPETIIDTATFEDDLSYSEGVRLVLVEGTAVVRDGELVEGVFPGRAVRGVYDTLE